MPAINRRLLKTERGQAWLAQFDAVDEETASRLANGLILVSHSTFERIIRKQLELIAECASGPVALFAARELKSTARDEFINSFGSGTIPAQLDAVPKGGDLGSEARIAATIRSLTKAHPKIFLNHPNIAAMRASKCKTLVAVDDLVGSGNRLKEFLSALWENRSLRSWSSRKNINFRVVAYAATETGIATVEQLKCKPKVILDRVCPTVDSLPWSKALRSSARVLCKKYAGRTSRRTLALGYGRTMAMLVFEHGCPNNVPAVFWAPPAASGSWQSLFPAQTVLAAEGSVFPPDLVRGDAAALLSDVGQSQLANVRARQAINISDNTLLILAFAAKGVRSTAALSFATGLNDEECALLFRQCEEWGFLTVSHRITESGLAELDAARHSRLVLKEVAPRGEESYYPKMLRSTV